MKLKDIGKEEYEWEEVSVRKQSNSEAWDIIHNKEVVLGGSLLFSYEEAKLWAIKLSRLVCFEI